MVSSWCRKSLWEREDIFIQGINLNNNYIKLHYIVDYHLMMVIRRIGSIKTQKIILEEYARLHDFRVVEVYVDDGYSGLNFNRPWFQRLLQDIENKKINQKIINYILICKNMKELVNLKY